MKMLVYSLLPLLLLPLYGYLDPGSGSVLLAILFTSFSLLYFSLRSFFLKGRLLWLRLRHRDIDLSTQHHCDVLIYSEGAQYWNLFQPVLTALLQNSQLHCVYWSSEEQDPGLQLTDPRLTNEYIGVGHRAFFRLNQAQATICLLSTPGLDVLQIRRSRGVKHYSHLIHSPQDIASYQLFSFDYYDSILVSGSHQIASLRMLEAKRQTNAKELLPTGLCYYDSLLQRLEHHHQTSNTAKPASEALHILVAPSWRGQSLLHQGGLKLLTILLEAGFKVTLRPHPQSLQHEKELLDSILAQLEQYPQLQLDRSSDNFDALMQADALVSDFSGIVFDFLFLFQKPVFTLLSDQVWPGYEWIDFDNDPWEISLINQLGLRIDYQQLEQLPQLLRQACLQQANLDNIVQLRQQSLYNFGEAGVAAAEHIQRIHQQLEDK